MDKARLTKTSANKKAAQKRPQTWKPGQSGNPKGAPKRGQSWQEIYSTIGNMTPKEAADYCRAVAGKIGSIGDQVTLKEAVVLRVFAALLFEPDARLLNAVMDRDEGKVPQPFEWRDKVREAGLDPAEVIKQVREWLAESSKR